ncbi:UDP-glucose/GDP-mannose dehydrogenase family protein [Mesobacillus subterraneus]|uniref:UDP-glucose dehydrogenase family protein n=1 Tax=Mesobacillus subterraneus TaxID=285983 RepID=UPI001CFC8818|nr:UDP-glucose/GDP-mannose dehydrogenase family protein [Mesobacillus subterraneus]WLR54497.1 UDP-glucose/GDP-mannose dehydrogenase family protein [Mesobacillus subterraneus]
MKIAVAGTGYVGLITGVCLAEMGYDVVCSDIREDKVLLLQSGCAPIYEPGIHSLLRRNLDAGRLLFTADPEIAYKNADIIFIAVGTPENPDGTANLDHVYEAAYTIGLCIEKDSIICTKSTVPVGTNERIKEIIQSVKPAHLEVQTVSTPEFLREGSAIYDFFHGDRIIIGTDSEEAAKIVEQIFLPLKIPLVKTDPRSAEMIKYASNAFLATKISFINEIAAICDKVGANIEEVAFGIGRDRRIGPQFLQAGIGYGGSCFPKDTKALVQIAGHVEHQFELLEAVIKVNNRQQILAVQKAKEMFGSLEGMRVAVLGLAFKPDTDDIREASSLTIIEALLAEGASVIAYDPVAIPNARKVFGEALEFTADIQTAISGAELALITTEWDHIKYLPLEKYVQFMKNPVIFDGRNCYSLMEVSNHPITYISIGRPPLHPKKAQKPARKNSNMEGRYDETFTSILPD